MALMTCAVLTLMSTMCVMCQRPGFAGRIPIGYPELYDLTTTTPDPLGNRFGVSSVTTERLPLEANGDRDLVNRLSKLPVDKQPFWFINWKALEERRKSPQTYPLRPNPFIESGNTGNQNPPVNSNLNNVIQNAQPQFSNGATNFELNNGGDLQNRFNSYPNSNLNAPQLIQTVYYKPEQAQYSFVPSYMNPGQASYSNNGLPNLYFQNQNNQPSTNSQNSSFYPSVAGTQAIIQNRFSDVNDQNSNSNSASSPKTPFISDLPPDQFKVLKVESVSSLTTPEGKITLTNPSKGFSVPPSNTVNFNPTQQAGISIPVLASGNTSGKKDPNSNFEIENSKVVYYSTDPQNPNPVVTKNGINIPLAGIANNKGPPRNVTSGLQVINSKIAHGDINIPNGQNPDAKIKTQNVDHNTMTSTDDHTVITDPKTNITTYMHKWGYQNQYNYTNNYQYHVPYTYTYKSMQPTKLT